MTVRRVFLLGVMFSAGFLGATVCWAGSKAVSQAGLSGRDTLHCWLDATALRRSAWAVPIFNAQVDPQSKVGITPAFWRQLNSLLAHSKTVSLWTSPAIVGGQDDFLLHALTNGPAHRVLSEISPELDRPQRGTHALTMNKQSMFGSARGDRLVIGSAVQRVRDTLAGRRGLSTPSAGTSLKKRLKPKGTGACVFRLPQQSHFSWPPFLGQSHHISGTVALTLTSDVAFRMSLETQMSSQEAAVDLRSALVRWSKNSWFYLTGTQFLFDGLKVWGEGSFVHISGRWTGSDAQRLRLVAASLLRLRTGGHSKTSEEKPLRNLELSPPSGQRIRVE